MTAKAAEAEAAYLPRKYTMAEIASMRDSIRWSYPNGVCYRESERNADIEDRLRTYILAGIEPAEVLAARDAHMQREFERQVAAQAHHEAQAKSRPAPKPLLTKADVLEAWWSQCVAKYDGATITAKDAYDGFSGQTLKRFANNKAPDWVNISQADMERFIDGKGVKSRHAMFAKRYDGIQVVISGNVASGNYST